MNQKSKEHQFFLSELSYYDSAQFIVNINQTNANYPSRSPNSTLYQKNRRSEDQSQSDNNEIYSMQHMKQFNQIKEFVEADGESLPLLIKADKNKGKKTLLCQIISHYQKYNQKTKIFIPNFSSVNTIYSEILYNIMVKLRLTFGINQKVEVNQEKIRRFFKYWLDITSDKIQKDNLGYLKSQKQTLVIIIDGVDDLTNSKNQKVFPQFWLPQKVPKNIKLIISGTTGQIQIQKLCLQNKIKTINLMNRILPQKVKNKLLPQINQLNQHKQLSLFQIKVLTWFLVNKPDLKIKNESSFEQIVKNYIIECSSDKLSQNQIKSLLLCLSLSKKGLTESELKKIMKLKTQSVLNFLYMFKPLISNYESYFLITNSQIKSFIQRIYDPQMQKRKKYHQVIAKVMKKQDISIRKLEEELYHLSQSENYFEIKQLITEIQNFLVLYTPPCKYLLCNLWKKLQVHLNSDPVFQYNKSVESFLTHYHPKEEQLFKIIYQLSMFFRQYSEFQGAKIPSFRHPLIKGDQQQLQQISVYEQLKHHKMTTSLKQTEKKKILNKHTKSVPRQNQISKSPDNDKKKTRIIQNHQSKIGSEVQLQRNSQINQSNQQQRDQSTIEEIECINLQIKQNRQKFRKHYLQMLQPYLKEFYAPIKKLYMNETFVKSSTNNTQMQEEEEYDQNIFQLTDSFLKEPQNFEKLKSSMILKNLDDYFEQNYHREELTKFYYYKEWIWIQFPWICQSLSSDFSQMIQQYIANPTEYMSMDKQLNFIKQVLKISKVSKQNKSAIYENKQIELHSIDVRKLKRSKHYSNASIMRNSVNNQTLQSRLTFNNKTLDVSQNVSDLYTNNKNIAKYQLDLSKIDQKLNTQVVKQLSNRCSYDSRVAINSKSRSLMHSLTKKNQNTSFLTQSINYDNKQNLNKLPHIANNIKQSRYVSQPKSIQKQVTSVKVHQNKLVDAFEAKNRKIQLQLNNLVNQNKQLKGKIQYLQKTSIMLDNIDDGITLQKNNTKLQDLSETKQKILKKQQTQQKLKTKLQTVIKICDNNQSHQKQSQILSTFLQNLKTVTKIEIDNSQHQTKKIYSFIEENRNSIKKLLEQKQKLINDLKQFGGSQLLQKTDIQDDIESLSSIPNKMVKKSLYKKGERSFLREKQQKMTVSSKHQSNHSAVIKNLRARTLKMTSKTKASKSPNVLNFGIWEQLSHIFHFDPLNYDQSIQNSKYLLQQFEQKVTKNKQLNLQCEQLYYQNEMLNQNVERLEQEVKTLSQKNQTSQKQRGQQNQSQQFIEKKKILEKLKNRSNILEFCIDKYTVHA